LGLKETFFKLEPQYRFLAIAGSTLGTFLGLFLWLKALSMGNVAQVAAMGGLSPVIAVGIESVLTRRLPGPHALVALGLCLVAVALLI
jgi:drug/metabolite transporter (DMT)-like permease